MKSLLKKSKISSKKSKKLTCGNLDGGEEAVKTPHAFAKVKMRMIWMMTTLRCQDIRNRRRKK